MQESENPWDFHWAQAHITEERDTALLFIKYWFILWWLCPILIFFPKAEAPNIIIIPCYHLFPLLSPRKNERVELFCVVFSFHQKRAISFKDWPQFTWLGKTMGKLENKCPFLQAKHNFCNAFFPSNFLKLLIKHTKTQDHFECVVVLLLKWAHILATSNRSCLFSTPYKFVCYSLIFITSHKNFFLKDVCTTWLPTVLIYQRPGWNTEHTNILLM